MGASAVLLTMGSKGAMLVSYERRGKQGEHYCGLEHRPRLVYTPFLQLRDGVTNVVPVPKVDVVDTSGAGDAFLGAFAYFLSTHSQVCRASSSLCWK